MLSEFDFPKPLLAEIAKLKKLDPSLDPYAPKKVLLLEKALGQFNALKLNSALNSSHLDPATSGTS